MTDKELAQLVAEEDDILTSRLPAPGECNAEFSSDFYRKMHKLIPSIDPETGEVCSSFRIWDEDTQKYI